MNVVDRWGVGPLSDAIRHRHDEIIELLVQAGAKIRSDAVISDLCQAAADGDLEQIQRIHRGGGEIALGDYDGRTPLHLAAAHNHVDVVGYLLQNGADAGAKDRFGGTAADDAARHGHEELEQSLRAKIDQ